MLETFGLSDARHKLAKTLSGGMKRRLNIALALVHDPEILILDEPQAGLDPKSRILVREYIRSLAQRMTVVLTTHDMDEIDRLAHRVGIIDHGQLLVLDTPQNLKNRIGSSDILEIKIAKAQEEGLEALRRALPENLRNFTCHEQTIRLIDLDTLDVLPDLLKTFQQTQMEVQDITIRKRTLEDVFIDLTGRSLRA